ncbi:MAG: hypothetical protein ILA11_04965 [Butyrivibrio sp.]|nr:hypothetical protein [Butyrivibrio sp.]
MAQEREDLIHSLAKSMGVGDAQKAKYTSNKFNTETGAMYANGHAIPRGTIEQAKVFLQISIERLLKKMTREPRKWLCSMKWQLKP